MPRPVQLSVVMLENGSKPGPPCDLLKGIKSRAREIYLRRGLRNGHDVDDWLTAEQEFVYRPAAEVSESEGDFVITLATPGFAAKDLKVDVASDAVVIEGRAACIVEESKKNAQATKVLFSEFRGKPIFRIFDLPFPIDPKQVTATWNDGLLRIVAKKARTAGAGTWRGRNTCDGVNRLEGAFCDGGDELDRPGSYCRGD